MFIGEMADRDLVARPLGRSPFVTRASPDYLARHGVPATPDSLLDHHTIAIRSSATGLPRPWRFQGAGRALHLPPEARAVFEAREPAVEIAACGGGALQMIRYLVAVDIEAGRLVPVPDDWLYPGADIVLVYPRHTRRPRVPEDVVISCFRSAVHFPRS